MWNGIAFEKLALAVITAALLTTLITMGGARAQTQDTFPALMLNTACDNKNSTFLTAEAKQNFENICIAYLRGLTDALFTMQLYQNDGKKTCFDKHQPVSYNEARELFKSYLRDHPNAMANSAGLVASMVLIQKYSCR